MTKYLSESTTAAGRNADAAPPDAAGPHVTHLRCSVLFINYLAISLQRLCFFSTRRSLLEIVLLASGFMVTSAAVLTRSSPPNSRPGQSL